MLTRNLQLVGLAYLKADDPPSKRKILQTALRLFANHGVDAITVRRIAQDSGYTNPALFKFFESKDSLALYLFECCYGQIFDCLKKAIDNAATCEQQLDAVLDVFLAQLEQNLEAFLFVQDHLRHFWPRVSAKTRRKSILSLIRGVLRRGMKNGSIRDADVDLMVAAVTGTLLQFARMLYFGEFAEKPSRWRAPLTAIIHQLVKP
jgi:TetR/AcrR family transcriptional regulator, repressor of fatR-cypB operon